MLGLFRRKVWPWVAVIVLVYSVGIAGPYVWMDVATLIGTLDQKYDICWELDGTLDVPSNPSYAQFEQIRRQSFEGSVDQTTVVPRATWSVQTASQITRHKYCITSQQLVRVGHTSYQIRGCAQAPPAVAATRPDCNAWASSLDPTVAVVNAQPRAWWIYGYVQAPGQPTPLGIPAAPLPSSTPPPTLIAMQE